MYITYYYLFLFYSTYHLLLLFILMFKVSQIWAVAAPLSCSCVLLTCPSYSFSLSVLSVTRQCSRLILSFPSSSSPGISQFSKELWAFLCRMEFRNQDPVLGVLTALGCDCFQTPSVNRTKGKSLLWYAYLYQYLYIKTNVQPYTYTSYVYTFKTNFLLILQMIINYLRVDSTLPSFCIFSSHPQQWGTWQIVDMLWLIFPVPQGSLPLVA